MPAWQIVLYTLLIAVVLGVIVGAIVSKSLKKRKDPNYKPVMSNKAQWISLASVLLGIAFIIAGILIPKYTKDNPEQEFLEGTPDPMVESVGDSDSAASPDGVIVGEEVMVG